jgi:hypothetical protein
VGGNVNGTWNGFLPQNELVKLAWAALEESQSICLDNTDAWCKAASQIDDTAEEDDEPEVFVEEED